MQFWTKDYLEYKTISRAKQTFLKKLSENKSLKTPQVGKLKIFLYNAEQGLLYRLVE